MPAGERGDVALATLFAYAKGERLNEPLAFTTAAGFTGRVVMVLKPF